jgi:Arc/MetJ-type ribon-helix-helix transcriptional regulator
MTKETVRYPDEVVAAVEDVIGDGVFESKSEFYRFSAEYVLDQLDDGYEPESFDYEEIVADLEDHGLGRRSSDADGGDFLAAVIEVRKRSLREEYEAAETVVDERYASHDREAILLEELLDRYRG